MGIYLTVWVVGDFVPCGGWGWVHTLLSGWYVILCGVHLRGTFRTGHGTSYDKCVGNTEIRNSP